jgi:hypothetical protein
MVQRFSTPRERLARVKPRRTGDGFVRETFALPRPDARAEARRFFDRFPSAAYMTAVESWRELDDGRIEFTMKRLPSAD